MSPKPSGETERERETEKESNEGERGRTEIDESRFKGGDGRARVPSRSRDEWLSSGSSNSPAPNVDALLQKLNPNSLKSHIILPEQIKIQEVGQM